MKRFLSAIALTCVLAVSALAGDLPTAGLTSTSPGDLPTAGVSSTAPTGTTAPGDLTTAGFAEEVSDAALYALLSVLGTVVV
ncbi:MAG TPA: hypothetical protein VEW46_02280 [Pyrinomonadaceae bacterium]|nr:hypothetical protein [Pyrinomonadaceae bacterium]